MNVFTKLLFNARQKRLEDSERKMTAVVDLWSSNIAVNTADLMLTISR